MNQDDKTPPGRPIRRAQTATERDLEGMRARAARHAAADDFEDQSTPPHECAPIVIAPEPSQPSLSDSQRDWFAQRLASGIPVVKTRDTPTPGSLIARTTTPDELEILRHFRLASRTELEEFVAKMFVELREVRADLNAKIESDSSDNATALQDLRELLNRPPNGRTKALEKRVDDIERSLATERSSDAVKDVTEDHRLKQLEADARFARRVAYAVVAFVAMSAAGVGLWLRSTGVDAGIDKQRLEYVIDAVKDLDRKLDRLVRWPLSTKDSTP